MRQAGDSIEALAQLTRDGVTASAWQGSGARRGARRADGRVPALGARARRLRAAVSPRRSAACRRRRNCSRASPRCRRCATAPRSTCPPRAHTASSSRLPLVLREFRRPLLLGLVLVVLDALAGDRRPVPRQDRRRQRRRGRRARRAVRRIGDLPRRDARRPGRRASRPSSSPDARRSGSCSRCGSGSGRSCNGSRWTTTSASWPAGS